MAVTPGAEVNPFLAAIFMIVMAVFLVGDLTIFTLWLVGRTTGRPILARYWSVADVFLGLQAVLGGVVCVSIPSMIALLMVDPGSMRSGSLAGANSLQFFFVLFLPMMVSQQAALVLVPLGFVWFKYRGTVADLGWNPAGKLNWRRLAIGAALVLPLVPLVDLVETLVSRLLMQWLSPAYQELIRKLAEEASALTYVEAFRGQPLILLALALIIGVIGPVAEEVFFRGFAYRALKERFGVRAGIVLSALLFAMIHGNPLALIPIFLIGLVLAWLYERTGSLAAPIGLHCANNLLAFAVFLLAPQFSIWERVIPR